MDKKIRVGIIGFGRMGRKYIEEMHKIPMWEIAYVCDCNEEARKVAAQLCPEAKVVSDENIVFEDPTVDVVGLFTLADARFGQIKKALANNKHIMAEKPIAEDIETEWELVKMIEASDRQVTVNIFNRNAWYHKNIISFIESGEIGDLAIIRICHMTPGHLPDEGHAPEGPCFHDCGMHYVDVARWYAKSEYATWHAQGSCMWSYPQPWWVQCHGTFENGVVFDITQGFVYGHLAETKTHNSYVDVIGTKGIARMTHDFKNATVELHGVTRTLKLVDTFNDKKIDVLCDVFGRSLLAGKNLGYPVVRDSVIASDMAWKMYYDAVKNTPPKMGTLEDLEAIKQHRRTLTNGYGLPCWEVRDVNKIPDTMDCH